MLTAAFNIFIYTAIFFLIGMIKPDWALFFMKKADRIMVLMISAVLFMVAATLFGEGTRDKTPVESTSSQTLEDSVPVVSSAPDKVISNPEKITKPQASSSEAVPEKEAN